MLTVIPHYTQHTNYDCGLACLSMILSGIGKRNCSLEDLLSLFPLDSIWTIDLAYLLRRFGVEDFTMYTCHIGVNWTHAQHPFYKDALQKDLKRIHHLFAKARESHVRVVPQQLSLNDIRRFLLSNRYCVLALVNLNLLQCHLCKEKQRKEWWKKWLFKEPEKLERETSSSPIPVHAIEIHKFPPASPSSSLGSSIPSSVPRRLSFGTFPSSPGSPLYNTPQPSTKFHMAEPLLPKSPEKEASCLGLCTQFSKSSYHFVKPVEFVGHFIVLIGYDPEIDMFFYRDPGSESKLCAIHGDDLEKAYSCQQTDHDLIVVRIL